MNTIRVFEYSKLKTDKKLFTQKHFEKLVSYNEHHGNKYFKVGNHCLYFNNYVGVFQVYDLVIEVLPKADQYSSDSEKEKWHNALLYMLDICGYIKLNNFSKARQDIQQITLIDIFYRMFLDEVTTLTHEGLMRAYRHEIRNLPHLKGCLVFNKHISENYLHKEKFYTRSHTYDHNNIFNQILYTTLKYLKNRTQDQFFHSDICKLLLYFVDIKEIIPSEKLFDKLVYSRNSEKYKQAIFLAKMILLNYSPNIKTGSHEVFGILFDMNLIFEKVVYVLLKRQERYFKSIDLKVSAQTKRNFWSTKTIRPDILGEYGKENKVSFILDTKWKIPANGIPSDTDLKQMFVYNAHFGVYNSFLVYPRIGNISGKNTPFYNSCALKNDYTGHTCSTYFIELVNDDGSLNVAVGKELIQKIKSVEKKQFSQPVTNESSRG